MPDLSTEDAQTAEKEELLQERLLEIAVARPGRGRNKRPSPPTSGEDRPAYERTLGMWQSHKLRKKGTFHYDRDQWKAKVGKNQATHRQLILPEGSDINPNAAFGNRGFQIGPGLPTQQHGDVTEGGPQTLSNKISCNPFTVGECANCHCEYGDITGNARMECVYCQNQMCMNCQNEDGAELADAGQITDVAYTPCRGCRRPRPVDPTYPSDDDAPGSGDEGDDEAPDEDRDGSARGDSSPEMSSSGDDGDDGPEHIAADLNHYGDGDPTDTCSKCGILRQVACENARYCQSQNYWQKDRAWPVGSVGHDVSMYCTFGSASEYLQYHYHDIRMVERTEPWTDADLAPMPDVDTVEQPRQGHLTDGVQEGTPTGESSKRSSTMVDPDQCCTKGAESTRKHR